jgi:hypothetical protein
MRSALGRHLEFLALGGVTHSGNSVGPSYWGLVGRIEVTGILPDTGTLTGGYERTVDSPLWSNYRTHDRVF